MVLTQRERYVGLATIGVIGLVVLYQYALTPLTERRDRLVSQTQAAEAEMARATQLFDNDRRMRVRWNDMVAAGLKPDPSAAESQALHALREWAQASGLSLTSLKPERSERLKPSFQQVTLRATGIGPMRSVGEFLWRIQTADIPVRVTDLQVTSRKEGTDDLALHVGISTLSLDPGPQKPGARGVPRAAGGTAGGREVTR